MMHPLKQELGISTNSSNNNVPTVNRSLDNIMEMPHSELPALSNNVSPSLEDQMLEQLQTAIGGQCSLLRGSLRPITLKFEDVSYSIKLKKSGGFWFSALEPKPAERTILNGITGVV
ncbi:PREDICTED: ABC transporter G family member 21-like [Nelumbo nucifera]|uniref:Uncharacterized protein n=2 Tax=Nelumbo nucifera TaxID=4432 RepID=A0A822ZZB6_NELNU|nr:PREDICTED: ABC transporter G family member 21-like [Nelumbo nucifera]DAD48861.1 TPA_asm: hypothetical protein HUJ06_018798 [Nelumbo nucifera]